ncbi:MAG: hypothetical protein ABW022_06275 [Actinoplanes sp.]
MSAARASSRIGASASAATPSATRSAIIASIRAGAPERIEAMIAERVADGVAALADAPIREDARAALVDLAVRATHRPS